jgi:WD40 repeat protein
MICEDCGQATDWSPDGRYLVGNSLDGRVLLLDSSSHRRTDLVALQGRWFAGGRFSPDGRWITFLDANSWREVIAPFRGDTPAEESTWISVLAELCRWSPDGSLVYGCSDHDGFSCIWAQRLEPATKRPVGAPLPIFHAHGARQVSSAAVSIGRDRIVFDMAERTGNIWMAEWKER